MQQSIEHMFRDTFHLRTQNIYMFDSEKPKIIV